MDPGMSVAKHFRGDGQSEQLKSKQLGAGSTGYLDYGIV
jgi:hypothetical protein